MDGDTTWPWWLLSATLVAAGVAVRSSMEADAREAAFEAGESHEFARWQGAARDALEDFGVAPALPGGRFLLDGEFARASAARDDGGDIDHPREARAEVLRAFVQTAARRRG